MAAILSRRVEVVVERVQGHPEHGLELGVRGEEAVPIVELQTKVREVLSRIITEMTPLRAFSWLKAATTAFTFKTLLRQYAKWTLTHGK